MNIYTILSSIPHNPHYLNRYVKFIQTRALKTYPSKYTETHHICPKALFPEYQSFSIHTWNKIILSPREHFISHLLLWKTFRGSMTFAFKCMKMVNPSQRRYFNITNKMYQKLKEDVYSHQSKILKGTNRFSNVDFSGENKKHTPNQQI